MIEAAILDLGQVVIALEVEEIPVHWADTCGAELSHVREVFHTDKEYHRLERGEMTMAEYHRHMTALIGREMAFDDFLAGWNCFYRGLMPGVTQMLAELAKSVRLIALTNTNPGHAAVWKKMFADTLESFERIFCSHEISTRKPEAQSYQIALDYLGIEGARAVFVDDKIKNVKAAEAMGMKGIVAADTESTMEKLRNLGAI